MKIWTEMNDLDDFEAWSGAVDTKERIVNAKLGEQFLEMLEDAYPEGMSDGELNDLLWFEPEWCYELVGLEEEEEEEEEK